MTPKLTFLSPLLKVKFRTLLIMKTIKTNFNLKSNEEDDQKENECGINTSN